VKTIKFRNKLQWFYRLIVFIVIIVAPSFFFNSFLDRYYARTVNSKIESEFNNLEKHLDFLNECSIDERFFHILFRKKFSQAKDSQANLEKSINSLKMRFPGALRFIVWNNKGMLVKALTDIESYNYIKKKLFGFLKLIYENCRKFYPGKLEEIKNLDKQIAFFSKFLGRFTIANQLNRPLLSSKLGRCVSGDLTGEFPLYWYSIGKEYSVFVFISKQVLGKYKGLKEGLIYLNQTYPNIKFGFILRDRENKIYTYNKALDQNRLNIEFQKYLTSITSQRILKKQLLIFKRFEGNRLYGFAAIDRDISLDSSRSKWFLVTKILLWTGIFFFLIYCKNLGVKQGSISVKWKLLAILLYVNGFPLMIFGSFAIDFVNERKASLLKEKMELSKKHIEAIDEDFLTYKTELSSKLIQKIDSIQLPEKAGKERNDKFLQIEALADQYQVENVLICNRQGKNVFKRSGESAQIAPALFKILSKKLIEFGNYKGQVSDFSRFHIFDINQNLAFGERLVNRLIRLKFNENHLLLEQGFFKEKSVKFIYVISDKNRRNFHSVIIFSWTKSRFQKNYLQEKLATQSFNFNAPGLIALSITEDSIIKNSLLSSNSEVKSLLYKADVLPYVSERQSIARQNFQITAMKKRNLDTFILGVVFPLERIERQVYILTISILAFIGFNLLIFSGIALSAFKQFFLPLKEVEKSILAVSEGDFSHRSDIKTKDEIETLGNVLNESLEGMKELEVAKVIQESLLPENTITHKKFKVHAKTITMKGVGGDYYDFFEIDDTKLGIIVGDVSGHGIQAGLIMAMAKTSVLINSPSQLSQSDLINAINKVFMHLKKENLTKMMTIFYGILNSDSGEVSALNAGQCFPVLVLKNGQKAIPQEIFSGMPLGIVKNTTYKTQNIKLNAGDVLVIFSDGFIEAKNEQGEFYTAERFYSLLEKSWNSDLELFSEAVFGEYHNWIADSEDDVTLVLIKYE
jgi:serine phosphatase RsbU (regulator of sigma subunit)